MCIKSYPENFIQNVVRDSYNHCNMGDAAFLSWLVLVCRNAILDTTDLHYTNVLGVQAFERFLANYSLNKVTAKLLILSRS